MRKKPAGNAGGLFGWVCRFGGEVEALRGTGDGGPPSRRPLRDEGSGRWASAPAGDGGSGRWGVGPYGGRGGEPVGCGPAGSGLCFFRLFQGGLDGSGLGRLVVAAEDVGDLALGGLHLLVEGAGADPEGAVAQDDELLGVV